MPIDLETIKRKKAYNDFLELTKNISFNTKDGLVESEKITFSLYQTRDAILRLTDLHNKALGKNTITDLGNLKKYECTNSYRNLNMSLNIQLTIRSKEFLEDFIRELNNIVVSLESIEGLESVMLTAISRSKREIINSQNTISLLGNFNSFGVGSSIAAGHNSGFYFNSMTSNWRNFTAESLTGYGEELYNLKNNWNTLGYSISKSECESVMKYAFGAAGAGIGFGLGITGTALSAGAAAPAVPIATTSGYLSGYGLGTVVGDTYCEKSNTEDTDSNTDSDLEDLDLDKLEAEEKLKVEKGCIVDPELDNLKFIKNEFMLGNEISSYYLKGKGINSFIKEINGSYKIMDMPSLQNNPGINSSKLTLDLGFMKLIPNLKNTLSSVILDRPISSSGQILEVPEIHLDQLRYNAGELILSNGQTLSNKGNDIINKFTKELENIDLDKIKEKLEKEALLSEQSHNSSFIYVIDNELIDNDLEENHTMHTLFIKSPSLRKQIGNTITVSELGLQAALEQLRLMEKAGTKIDALTNWGNLDLD